MRRRTMLQAISVAPTLFSTSLWAAEKAKSASTANLSGVYELRVYHAAAGKLPELLARFRDHTMALFKEHGMESVAYWTPLDEPEKSNMLIYILYHPSREAATGNWQSFRDDPKWKAVVETTEGNGKLVDKVDVTFMALTDFSPRLIWQAAK